MAKFFYPNKKEFSKKEFIEFYSKCYYMDVNVSVENKITELLEKGKDNLTEEDIFIILAWKMGKIEQKKSYTNYDFDYYSDWNKQKLEGTTYGKSLDFSKIKECLSEIEGEELEEYIEHLRDIPGLGNVYILTLRYFATNGKYPIYDRYAYKALKALQENAEIFEPVNAPNMSGASINSAKKYYNEYQKMLNDIFSTEEILDRRIDQALWKYGHLFPDSKN